MVLYRHARFAHLTGRRHHSNDTTCQDASSLVLPGCKFMRSRQVISITYDGQQKRCSENYNYVIKSLVRQSQPTVCIFDFYFNSTPQILQALVPTTA